MKIVLNIFKGVAVMDEDTIKKGMDMAHDAGKFIAPLIKGTLEQGIGIFEDKLKYIRWERQKRMMRRSKEILKELGVSEIEDPIPLKFAIPLLQGSTMEENDNIQDLWINLLINSVANKKVELKRVYMDILERISPLEAKIITEIYKLPFEENRHQRFATDHLPDYIYYCEEHRERELVLTDQNVELALMNLARIGCISPTITVGGGELFTIINMTLLGARFYDACTL